MTSFKLHYPRLSDCWCALLLAELVRLGVRHCCIAPGSRSTPLTLAALAEPGLECEHHFDERGLGFYALGLAKSSGSPVVLITTSGSAVANLYPALIEAAQTAVPLVVLAADRPPELIGCGANQAIEQSAIFASYPVWQRQLPVPDEQFPPQALLSLVDEGVSYSAQGPVFINCPFREPFYPGESEQDFSSWLRPVSDWLNTDTPWTNFHLQPPLSAPLPEQFFQAPGVIVAGALKGRAEADAVLALAQQSGWPVLADPQSGLGGDTVITGLDLLFQQPGFIEMLEPAQHLLQVGARLVSKRLLGWMAGKQWQHQVCLSGQAGRLNPDHPALHRYQGDIAPALARWTPEQSVAGPDLSAWSRWRSQALDQFAPLKELNELSAARLIGDQGQGALFLANSLPVRLFEQLALRPQAWQPTYCNRGASGIDGLLASAAGVARGEQLPLTLLVGDLALLHDLNSLALCARIVQPLVIVLLNNDGGAIFNMLPVPDKPEVRDFYRCAHGLTAEGAASMFGLSYHRPDSLDQLQQRYCEALEFSGTTLIELCTPAEEATTLLRQLGGRVAQTPGPDQNG